MNYWLLLVPVISALIAWICSRISITILFHQILPAKKAALAETIAQSVSSQFSFSTIENKLQDPSNAKKIMPVVESHVDDFLRNKLKAKIPMIGMLIGEKTIGSLKEVFLKEIEEMFPQVISTFAGNLKADIDIKSMVAARINAIDTAQLQKQLKPALRYYELTLVITGVVIGLINLAIFLLI